MKTTELKEGQELLTEVPSDETGKLLTEIIPDEVKKEEELLTEGKTPTEKQSSKGPRVKKSKRELGEKKETPPEVLEAIEKISAAELAKEAALVETPVIDTDVDVDISPSPGTFFPADEAPCASPARRGFRFVRKKAEEYTPSERKSLLKTFSRRTLRTRYGIEF